MRLFFEAWNAFFEDAEISNHHLASDDLQGENDLDFNNQLTKESEKDLLALSLKHHSTSDVLSNFMSIGFTHHREILSKTNFNLSISKKDIRAKALRSFKDEYLLDYINLEDPDEDNEQILESSIVNNIKKFIMSFGHDFCFMGNQFRIIINEKEVFVDLLFFHRSLNCLVAIELKRGDFKPAYSGQLNFYLSALDEYVKHPNENPSIGIILCKGADEKFVQLSVRDVNKPIGVATYKTANDLPKELKKVLPNLDELKRLL